MSTSTHNILAAILIASLLLSPAAGAAEEEHDFQVEVNPATYPKKAFASKGVKVSEIPKRVKRPDALPEKNEREKAIAAVPELEKDIANMDELNRDLLFVRARTKPLKELQNIYPGIEEKKLAKLREILLKSEPKN